MVDNTNKQNIDTNLTKSNSNNNNSNDSSNKSYTCLVCDIGGTNSRMSLVSLSLENKKTYEKLDEKKLKSNQYKSLTHLISEYLSPFKETDSYPKIALLAIPGPVRNNKVSVIANLMHWPEGNGSEIEKELGIKKVILLNDFVAIGYGVTSNLELNKDYFNINYNYANYHDSKVSSDNKKAMNINEDDHEHGTYICIGAGTGLGHCIGYKTDHMYSIKRPYEKVEKDDDFYIYHDVIPSEGGHQTFSPHNNNEFNFRNYMVDKLNLDHVSHERVCSGPAIPYMYNYFLDKIIESKNNNNNSNNTNNYNKSGNSDYNSNSLNIDKIRKNSERIIDYKSISPKLIDLNDKDFDTKRWKLTPEVIVKAAVKEECPVSVLVRDMFLEILATECSNFSLATLPYKGVFLVGSITNSFKDYLLNNKNNVFVERFFAKGRLSEWLSKLPIYLVVEEHIGILGCMEYARRMMESLVKTVE